jgi:hypothetical protein
MKERMADERSGVTRRQASLGVLATGMFGGRAFAQAPAVHRPVELRWTSAIPLGDFCAPNLNRPQAEALQAALDAAFETGLPLIFPRGDWVTDRMLTVTNPDRKRRGGPILIGTGDTHLRATSFEGALLRVRGAPTVPPAGSFFLIGGGIERIEFHGAMGPHPQNGLDVLGWGNAKLDNCIFQNFSGHGIRCHGDLALDPNPDWTGSIMHLTGVMAKRNRGWGYLDDHPIGAPGWTFDRCVFQYNGGGGAYVRSSGNVFNACAFAQNGFVAENKAAAGIGVGLRISDTTTTVNRARVVVAEFDSNKDAHIMIDRCTSFLIEDARFIHNDRDKSGYSTPPVAVVLGVDHPRSLIRNGRITRPVFRLDTPGTVTGFKALSPNMANVVIERGFHSDETVGKVVYTPYEGFAPPADLARRHVVLETE